MDDWQETAFSNRHVHNRIGRKGRSKGAKAKASFDVRNTFGTYEIDCRAAERRSSKSSDAEANFKLEICRLNEAQNALLGELTMAGVLRARIIMTGSRKAMENIVEGMKQESNAHMKEPVESGTKSQLDEVHNMDQSQETEDEEESEDEIDENSRFKTFEKNSFRSPKFWLWWQGEEAHGTDRDHMCDGTIMKGTGYVVFSGNDCRAFTGTISCSEFAWENVKMSGHKTKSKPERDFDFHWLIHSEDNEV